jgi:hypothetical protein
MGGYTELRVYKETVPYRLHGSCLAHTALSMGGGRSTWDNIYYPTPDEAEQAALRAFEQIESKPGFPHAESVIHWPGNM